MLLAELIQRSQATVELEQLSGSEAPQGGQEPLKCLYKMAEQSSPIKQHTLERATAAQQAELTNHRATNLQLSLPEWS